MVAGHYGRHSAYRPSHRPRCERQINVYLMRGAVRPLVAYLRAEFSFLGEVQVEKASLFRRDRWVFYTDKPMSEALVKLIEAQASLRPSADESAAKAHGVLTVDMGFYQSAIQGVGR